MASPAPSEPCLPQLSTLSGFYLGPRKRKPAQTAEVLGIWERLVLQGPARSWRGQAAPSRTAGGDLRLCGVPSPQCAPLSRAAPRHQAAPDLPHPSLSRVFRQCEPTEKEQRGLHVTLHPSSFACATSFSRRLSNEGGTDGKNPSSPLAAWLVRQALSGSAHRAGTIRCRPSWLPGINTQHVLRAIPVRQTCPRSSPAHVYKPLSFLVKQSKQTPSSWDGEVSLLPHT